MINLKKLLTYHEKLFSFCNSSNTNRMVQEWTLCIQVSCYPNPGQAIIEYVLHNNFLNDAFQRKRKIRGRTTNNEAYYIVLIEGLKTIKMYSANDICVYTNSLFLCNQMKGIYQVRKKEFNTASCKSKNHCC